MYQQNSAGPRGTVERIADAMMLDAVRRIKKRRRTRLWVPDDPVILARRAGLVPDPWQADVLHSSAQQLLLNCSRQSGKSQTTATLALYTALYQPVSLVLLLSPSLRQSSELFKKVTMLYRVLGRPIAAEAESALRLELDNGSRIVALPGKEGTVRGYSGVRLLIVDEASRVEDDLYYSIRPMLAVSGGRLVALSTPFGKRGWWFDAWQNGGAAWERVEVRAEQCPRIPADFLAEERRALPPHVYASEYECQFVDNLQMVFSSDLVRGMISAEARPLAVSW